MKETKKIIITPEKKKLLRKELQERMRIRRKREAQRREHIYK